jgi:uncharacterized membrane protein
MEKYMPKYNYCIFFLLFSGCNYSVPNGQGVKTVNQTIEKLPTGTIPSYQTVASEIIAPKCLVCHANKSGNAGGINLETYANVSSKLGIISSTLTSGSMPKNGITLSAKEKEVFLAWIDAGGSLDALASIYTPVVAPNPAAPPPIVTVDPKKIDYKMVNSEVIGPRCISCHSNQGGNRDGINLESYENVFNERTGIKNQVRNGSMPTGSPLTSIQKQTILTWLNNGAPETVP